MAFNGTFTNRTPNTPPQNTNTTPPYNTTNTSPKTMPNSPYNNNNTDTTPTHNPQPFTLNPPPPPRPPRTPPSSPSSSVRLPGISLTQKEIHYLRCYFEVTPTSKETHHILTAKMGWRSPKVAQDMHCRLRAKLRGRAYGHSSSSGSGSGSGSGGPRLTSAQRAEQRLREKRIALGEVLEQAREDRDDEEEEEGGAVIKVEDDEEGGEGERGWAWEKGEVVDLENVEVKQEVVEELWEWD
ncbi:hypothetical protein EDC01DRAFT_749951 [Geopyxis carbonaria]|nr:hypothetical protein EDC01DRAFT_749951 [Geopyxis carbonaria]